jgi:D-alanyl-D-alanine carboxypeptidase
MKIVKQILLILATTGLLLVSHTAFARHAALLIDAESGNVLYELEANQSWYPASLTKLMTLYMAFSALESGRLRLSDRMSISSHAAHQPTSKLGLRAWDTISVEDAILAVVTRSANDAAVVLAEKIAGSETQFAIQMTSAAHNLGMYGSHFMNATGLPHDWQTTTAHDMALLALKIIRDFPQYYPYFGVDSLYHNGRYLRSTNKFVAHYPGAEGMKTGYTCGSGYNLVATANQYGKRLIGVVLGGHTSSERYQHMFTMMDIGFGDEYGAYRAKNINTMSKSSVGTPPYQLSCGHRPSSHYAARHIDVDEDDDHQVRYLRKTTHTTRHPPEKSRPMIMPREITKIRIAGKTKTIVRQVSEPRYIAKASSNSRNESKKSAIKNVSTRKNAIETAAISRKTGKNKVEAVTKNKSPSTSGNLIQTAKVDKHGKGYYVPGSKDKKTSASAATKNSTSKSKGYYKAESSGKTVAKTTVKSKKTTKKKS